VRSTDEPLADLTIVPLLAVSRLAREHVKVALSGEGADEVLAGYAFNTTLRNFETIRRIQKFPQAITRPAGRALALFSSHYGDRFAEASRIPLSQWNIAHNNHITWLLGQTDKVGLWPAFSGRDSGRILRELYSNAQSQDPMDQILSVYQKSWLVEDLLMKADKLSMAASLELRVPFLDYRLVEWANRQPMGVKLGRLGRQNVTKRVLRRFAQKRLPREIVERPKKGFPVPVFQWLKEDSFNSWAVQHLTGTGSRLKRLFQPHEMTRQLDKAAAGVGDAAQRSWLLIVLETWLREFDVEVASDMPTQSDPALVAN
jgi:asparagine synthase (glutamine-hydrolysing)